MSIKEYLDRNRAVCSSYGVTSACENALERLSSMKRPPKWLVHKFEEILKRGERMRPHLIEHREELANERDRFNDEFSKDRSP